MFCSHCGQEIPDEAVICPKCGCQPLVRKGDGKSFGIALLSFFIPLVGLILYFVWKKEKPLRAGSAGKGFVTLVIVALAACVAYFVFIYIMLLNAITDGIEGAFIGGMFI